MVNMTESEILRAAHKAGHVVIGGHVFTSVLGAWSFIRQLGESDCEPLGFGVSRFIVVRRK
jgi:hypothetical protein